MQEQPTDIIEADDDFVDEVRNCCIHVECDMSLISSRVLTSAVKAP